MRMFVVVFLHQKIHSWLGPRLICNKICIYICSTCFKQSGYWEKNNKKEMNIVTLVDPPSKRKTVLRKRCT